LLAAILLPCLAFARPPVVGARLVPDSVAIGDRFELEVTVDKDTAQQVAFPPLDREGIEVVEERAVDTLESSGPRVMLGKRYVLTTFDEGVHAMGPLPVVFMDGDTLWSADSPVLQVGSFVIDTTTMTIRDLKPLLKEPVRVGEFSGYALWALLVVAAVAGALWWLIKHRPQRPAAAAPREEPHVEAIRELEKLHREKLWQHGKHKLYYTRLTDILRRYMEGRWGIAAPEMTSDETLAAAHEQGVQGDALENLRSVLHSADLVKFAKYTPEPEENEAAWNRSYNFVSHEA
jgi:hypothetical protein